MEEVLPWILDRLHHIGLSPDAESLAAGLLCGERSLIAPDAVRDIRDAGMSHLLAVSGLHIGMLWGLITFLLRRLLIIPFYFHWNYALWNDICKGITLVLLWSYVCIIGWPPSAVRATVLISIAQISPFFQVRSLSFENLILAALLMLCADPMLYGDVGFQLSFAATAGIVMYRRLMTEHVSRSTKRHRPTLWHRMRFVRVLFWVTFSAQLFTMPLCAYYFHHLPLLGWIQGFIVVPVISLLLYWLIGVFCLPVTWGTCVICGDTLYHWLSYPIEALSWWVLQVAHWVSQLELWMVGGRVEFYPSLGETILLQLIVIGASWAAIGLWGRNDVQA